MDDKAQMLALEAVLFAISVIVALIFLYQLSPSSTMTHEYTNELKIEGDEALNGLYTDIVEDPEDYPQGFPPSKLVYYIVTGDDEQLVNNLNQRLPQNTMYNIWIGNETKTIFFASSELSDSSLPTFNPVTTSHYIIAIHPNYLDGTVFIRGKLFDEFIDPTCPYDGSTYEVILEMWSTP